VTRFAGASSEIDTGKLVDSLIEARRLPAVRLEAKITSNEAKIAAYDELKDLLQNLKSSVASLRNPPGVLGVRENLFERKEVYYSADTATSPATLLSVSAANEVPPGRFELVVEQLAAARKLSSGSTAGADQTLSQAFNGGAAFSGSFAVGLAGGGTATIAVTGDMDIHDLKAAINARSAEAGVTASVVKVADGHHRLVVTATEPGKEVLLSSAGGDDVLALTGLSSDGGVTFANPLATPREARVRIDGVTVTRPSNQIADAIGGVTLNLFKAEPGTTVTVEVERSLAGVKEQVRGFADAYNAFRDFVAERAGVSGAGEVGEAAVLFGDPVLRGLAQSLGGQLTAPVAGLGAGAGATSLAGIGLRLDGSNRLSLDEAALDARLLGNLDAVRDVLEFRFAADSPELGVFARTNALADSSFTVSVVDADSDGVPESATADGVALDVRGGRLSGRDGTAYAGLEMIWTGQGNASIGVTATQGVADRVYNMLDSALDDLDGTLSQGRQALGERNTAYRAEIDRIEVRAERYRQQLVERFGAMETALAIAKSMMDQLRASVAAFSQDG
jgi:flagellar hook-associated protein 2